MITHCRLGAYPVATGRISGSDHSRKPDSNHRTTSCRLPRSNHSLRCPLYNWLSRREAPAEPTMVRAPFSAAFVALLFVAVTAVPLRQENTASRDTLIPVDPTPSTTAPDGDGYGQAATTTVRLGSAGFPTKRPSIRGMTDGLPDSTNGAYAHGTRRSAVYPSS
jgi:hypothetical protein